MNSNRARVCGRKKGSPCSEVGARIKELVRAHVQQDRLLAVHLQKSNADGDALVEEPFGPCDRLVKRYRLSLQRDRAPSPSLAAGQLVRTVDAESVGMKRRFGARDGFERAYWDDRRAGIRESLKGRDGNLCIWFS